MNALGTPFPTGPSRAAFPRSARLVQRRDFQQVFDRGVNVVGSLMVVWIGEPVHDRLRLGVIASKRTFRRAVDRNRAKRLIREAFRLNCRSLDARADLVIVARRRILKVKLQAVEKELKWALRKARILDYGKHSSV